MTEDPLPLKPLTWMPRPLVSKRLNTQDVSFFYYAAELPLHLAIPVAL